MASSSASTPNYFDWRETFPELEVLYSNIDVIREEMKLVPQWIPWPEEHRYMDRETDWTVFPFMYTFPAYDVKASKWVGSTSALCPKTVELLKQIPTLRTALMSKLGPGTNLSTHTGWEDLANYVLRCHVGLQIPGEDQCGMIVSGEVQYHQQDEILVFDDSKKHRAFNNTQEDRIILIVDLARPSEMPLGTAVGGHTAELDSLLDKFR